MNHLEIEYKQLLSKDIYTQIKQDLFKDCHLICHTNHYMSDKKGILSNLRYSLRVRELNDTYEFTLKIPSGFAKMEINDMISKDNFENLQKNITFNSPVLDNLKKVDVTIEDLYFLTSLTTYRLEKEYQGGVLCIDESHYGDVVDYEMEYEATSEEEGKVIFETLLQNYNLTYTNNCPGKFTRALQHL